MTAFKEYRTDLKENNIRCLLLCIAGILLNLIPSYIVSSAGIPLWMDTIGTLLTAIMGGYLPGIFVGFVTNILKGFNDTTSVFYAVLNVLIAVSATFLSRRGWLDKIPTTFLFAILISLIGGGIGGILPWLLSGFPTRGFLMDMAIDLVDKIVSVGVVVVILYFVPEKYKDKLIFKGWMQSPLTREEEEKSKNIRCRSLSLRSKILLILGVSLVFLAAAATTISFILYRNAMIEEYELVAKNVSVEAADVIDPEMVDEFVELGEDSPGYTETANKLKAIMRYNPEVSFLYACRILENGCQVVFNLDRGRRPGGAAADARSEAYAGTGADTGNGPDTGTGADTGNGLKAGDIIPFKDVYIPDIEKMRAGQEVEPVINYVARGWLLTAYTPLRNQAGECVCYIGTDLSMVALLTNEMSFTIQMLFLFLGFVILILTAAIWFVDYSIIYPVNSIALRTQEVAFENEEDFEENIERMKELDIHTGDEIENLYRIFIRMEEKLSDYLEEIGRKTETISTMQTSLIMVLADMVESRDQSTGQHVRKTAAYVGIILKKMKEMGMHKDVLTDEYINNVVNSSPLHDLGKIQIPDAVLNKPGKLDDVEFEIMKFHTLAGTEVIDRVIAQVPECSYLEEARDMAHYHHEKWNGKGYPEGLSRTDIPLSARVMAVADVFDAVVSRRVYKPPMSIDKAMGIIREGAGIHFDPDVVEAFFAAEEEIRKVEREFEDYGDELEN